MPKTTGWRKVATSTWGWPQDPQIYGRLELDAVPVLEAIREFRERTGVRVTATTLVTRALAVALSESPTMNTRLRFGRFVPRQSVDVFVIVAVRGADLSGVTVRRADRKPAADIAREVEERAPAGRAG